MALIPQAKCPRCDRRYSGLRTKCPFCGARRYTKSTRAVSDDNSMWKIIVGIVLLVVLIAAVVVLIVTGGGESGTGGTEGRGSGANSSGVVSKDDKENNDDEEKQGEGEGETGGESQTGGEGETGGEGNTGAGGESQTGTGGESQTGTGEDQTPTHTVRAQSVAISNAKRTKRIGVYNSTLGMYEFTMYVGSKQAMSYMVTPAGVESTAEWSVDNEERASILQDGTLTALKAGNVYVTVSIDGISDTVLVRIKDK